MSIDILKQINDSSLFNKNKFETSPASKECPKDSMQVQTAPLVPEITGTSVVQQPQPEQPPSVGGTSNPVVSSPSSEHSQQSP